MKNFDKLHPPTLQGYFENRARVTINGKRMRLGNPKHPFHPTYIKEGMWKAFEKMGLTKKNNSDKLVEIKKHMSHSFNEIIDGYIYIMANPAWKGWVKIGMAVDAEDRLKGYQTSSPLRDYKLELAVAVDNRREAESIAHERASWIAQEERCEWFKMPLDSAIEIVRSLNNEVST